MTGTKCCTDGLRRFTRSLAPVQWPLVVIALVVLAGGLVAAWIKTSTWTQLRQLEDEFAALSTESFYLGVRLRAGVERLNGALLRFQLSKADPAEREAFYDEARFLSQLLVSTQPHLTTTPERELVRQIELEYDRYLTNAEPLLEKGVRAVRRDSASLIYEQSQELSKTLRALCEQLVQAQTAAWQQFLAESESTVVSLRRLGWISVVVLLALVLAMAALIYRALVAPLRLKLSATEAVVERQEKLASLGTLAAGVAHEIRNPLTAIKFRLFTLKKALPGELAGNEDIHIIGSEINRLERIVKEFLQFARPSKPEMVNVPAQQILQTVHDLLQPQLEKQGIPLKLEPSDAVWVRGDLQQLVQVLINLVQNSADSIGRDGMITLRTKEGAARLNGRSTPAVILEVADAGKGIPADVQKRLFDPFFSTKEGGTGLGLPIAERIVENHGGLLQYQTQLNRGTTFQVVLPRLAEHEAKNPSH